jgi:hypothetical protein
MALSNDRSSSDLLVMRVIAFGVALSSAVLASSEPLEILSIVPSGEDVPPARQIVLQFDRPVVPVGRMERDSSELPIAIDPFLECEWRWLNTSALACQLGEDEALRPATRYRLTVRPGIRTEDGSTLSEAYEHVFITQRPAVSRVYFSQWRSPTLPEIWLSANQAVARASLEEHLFMLGPGDESFRVEVSAVNQHAGEREEGLHWLVKPVRELPVDAAIQLRVEPGIVSLRGWEPSVERKAVLEFYTFPEFRFLGVECSTNDHRRLRVSALSEQTAGRCNPMAPVALLFSSPVIKDVLQEHLLLAPDLAGGRDDYDPWGRLHSYSQLRWPRSKDQVYRVNLPELLRADREYRLTGAADEIRDEFDRPLAANIDLRFHTDDRPPNLVLANRVSVLERDVETHLPAVVTNLRELRAHFSRLTSEGRDSEVAETTIPVARNVAFAVPLKVRDWLAGRSGAIIGGLDSEPQVFPVPISFFSQLTPFAVHVKLGHRNTVVWVTELATGDPVEGARVRVYLDGTELDPEPEILAESRTDGDGLALLAGSDEVDPELSASSWLDFSNRYQVLWVRVDKGEELALLPLTHDFRLRSAGPNNTWIPQSHQPLYGHIRSWGTTAQGVYRVGDTVQYKLYVRDEDNLRLVPAPRSGYRLRVLDPMDKLVAEVPELELNEFGAFDGEFLIPSNGSVGWYRFELGADFDEQ